MSQQEPDPCALIAARLASLRRRENALEREREELVRERREAPPQQKDDFDALIADLDREIAESRRAVMATERELQQCRGAPPVPPGDPCAAQIARVSALERRRATLRRERRALEEERRNAPPQQKDDFDELIGDVKREIEANRRDIRGATAQLRRCRVDTGTTDPLTARLTGTAIMRTTHPDAEGPTEAPVSAELGFSFDRRIVSLLSLAPITTDSVVVTAPRPGTPGEYDSETGQMSLGVVLHVNIKNRLADDPEDEAVTFTTGVARSPRFSLTGSALEADGDVTLVGVGQFTGGTLNGRDYSFAVEGDLSPHPDG